MTTAGKSETVEIQVKKKYLMDLLEKSEKTKPVTCIHIYADYDDEDVLTIIVKDETQGARI